jgi:CHAT domain-containing protein
MPWLKSMTGKGLKCTCTFLARWAHLAKENFPIQWATTQNNRANAYSNRIKEDRAENLENAIAGYESALEILTKENFPIECLTSARNLGTAYFNQGHWQQAIDVYEIAMQAAETSRSWSVNDSERQRVLKDALSVYENTIQCAVNLKDYQKAISYSERIRSRQLVELMASKDLYSDAKVPAEIQAYLTEYHQLSLKIENLRDGSGEKGAAVNRSGSDFCESSEAIKVSEARRHELYEIIRSHDQVLAGQIAVAPINYSEIQQLITSNHTAILSFYSTNGDTHIFIIKQNQEPEIFTCSGQGWDGLQKWLIDSWLIPYQTDKSAWQSNMPQVLAEISDRLQLSKLVANHLDGIQELILVPHLLLHQIPFAALPISDGFLGDQFTVRSIPSCQILQYCQQRPKIQGKAQGIVEDADGSLMGARYEGKKIAEIHLVKDADRLRGKIQATVANYRLLLSRINRIHSSHHACSRLDNPLESALNLADGDITLGDLLLGEKYPDLDEVFLSACETHVGKFTFTDDVATLTTGFLCIGARSVQSTLWAVSDLVTTIFDVFYHQERSKGFNRAVSLKLAQASLRNLSGEDFRLSHYPELQQFLDTEQEAIEQRVEQLTIAKGHAEGVDRAKILLELDNLEVGFLDLEGLRQALDRYCQRPHPFASPYYWAGSICQGMA